MSVRVCYLQRRERGAILSAVRLVGQSVDELWRVSDDSPAAARTQLQNAAGWIADRLGQSRAAGELEMLCLDADGGVCSWVTSPSRETNAVAAIARLGPSTSSVDPNDTMAAGTPAPNALVYFAGDSLDSSVQPLAEDAAGDGAQGGVGVLAPGRKTKARRGEAPQVERLPVLAATDVPARVLIDALDTLGVGVNSVTSIWHLLAQAWDPSSPLITRPSAPDEQAEDAPTTAVVLIDPVGRLVWSWSVGGALRAGGSMRLRLDPEQRVMYGRAEASRLRGEWLAWSLQTGLSPRRVVCIAPTEIETSHAQQFGAALAAIGGAEDGDLAVDLAAQEDPIGATLSRVASALEDTASPIDSVRPTRGLAELTQRPTRANRRLWVWAALVITAASALLGIIAWQWRRDAAALKLQTSGFEIKWKDEVGKVYPDALGLRPEGPKRAMEDELARRRAELLPAERAEPAMPVMEEFETISLVLGTGSFALTAIDVGYEAVSISVQARSIEDADALYEALQRVSGSRIAQWTPQFDQINITGADGKPTPGIRATIRGVWDRTKRSRESAAGGGT